jgi:mannosyltransferase OCH1-like enzyme
MIPKIIHYCWFGGNPIPEKDQRCIASWKKMCPDYEIKKWDESNYNINQNPYMREAYEAKKWGFVPDYARLDIIYNYGGIYLDTDVELIRNLDALLENHAFMGFEDGKHVSPGLIIAAEPYHETVGVLMDIYKDRHFLKEDGSFDLTPSPTMNTDFLTARGLIQNNKKQTVADITIYPTEYFCPKDYYSGKINKTENTYSIHWFNASWQSPYRKRMLKVRRVLGDDLYFKLVKLKNKIIGKQVK